MIKRILLVIFVVAIASGCGMALDKDNNQIDENNDAYREGEVQIPIVSDDSSKGVFVNDYKTILMENVQSGEVLLYEKIAFTQIEFSVRGSTSYSAGKDIYNIAYLSSSKPKDIYDVYAEYIDTVTEERASEYSLGLQGTVDGLPISVSVGQEELLDLEGYPVRITISQDPEKFQEDNIYFNEYPDLVEIYKVKKEGVHHSESTYIESYLDGTKTYLISFLTSATNEDFISFYTETYSNKLNFKYEEDEYQNHFSWTDSGYEHKITLQRSNSMASLYVKAPLP